MTAHAVAIGRPGLAALHSRRRVEAPEPVVEHEGLVAAQLLVAVDEHRRALRRVAELVDVGRDRRDAGHAKVPRRRPLSPFSSMNGSTNPPMHASTCIDAPTVRASSASSGIGSMTPCGYCGAEPTTSAVFSLTRAAIASTSARKSARTGTLCTRSAEVVRALVERGVRALGEDDLGFGDTALVARPFPRRLHREQDALGSARRHEPRRGRERRGTDAAHASTTSDWISARLGNAAGVQCVLVQEHRGGGFGDLAHFGPAVEHHARTCGRPASARHVPVWR